MLRGKLSVVTGGGGLLACLSGVCHARFAAEGSRVVSADRSKDIALKGIAGLPGDHTSFAADVTSSASLKALADAIKRHYAEVPTVVVHCAGIVTNMDGLLNQDEEVWERSIRVNLTGTLLVNKTFIGLMREAGVQGSVVNLASLAAEGMPYAPDYSAGKAGVIGLTKSIAREFGRFGIRVNAVAPSYVESPMARSGEASDKVLAAFAKIAPLKRIGKPEEVAEVCLFYASPMSSYITAGTTQVSGGMTS